MCTNQHDRHPGRYARQTPQYVDSPALEALALAKTTNAYLGDALTLAETLLDQLDDLRHNRFPRLIQRTPGIQLTLPGVQDQMALWAS